MTQIYNRAVKKGDKSTIRLVDTKRKQNQAAKAQPAAAPAPQPVTAGRINRKPSLTERKARIVAEMATRKRRRDAGLI
jgi:hypothetical protein